MSASSLNENAQKWVRALRSGLFKQGQGYLHTSNENNDYFCCLGVACELARIEGVEVSVEKEGGFNGITFKYDGSTGLLPESVQKWLGLRTSEGAFDDPVMSSDDWDSSHWSYLTELNDSSGWTFESIADFIEQNPQGLFEQ